MNKPLHVATVRTVKAGSEAEFEQALHQFVQDSLTLPGQLGVQVIRPAMGSGSREYGIIRQFESREALEAFRSSREYRAWTHLAVHLTDGGPRAEELSGLESWFTAPGAPLRSLPPWKMAIITYLGVAPVTLLLALTLERFIGSWEMVLNNLVFNLFVVGLLTWVVMPLLTRALRGWLYSD